MSDNVENFGSMMTLVFKICDDNVGIVNSVSVFGNKIGMAKNKHGQINQIINLLDLERKGVTATKKDYREIVEKGIFVMSNIVRSYAYGKNDKDLALSMKISKTDIKKMRDEDVHHRAVVVYEKANEVIADLDGYGVTANALADYKDSVDLYGGYKQQPKNIRIDYKNKRELMDVLIKELKLFMTNEVDSAAEVFSVINPAFYGLYKKARKVPKTGKHKLVVDDVEVSTGSFGITVLDKDTLEPIMNAQYEIVVLGIVDETDEDGEGYKDMIVPNSYEMTVVHELYVTANVTVVIKAGEETAVVVEMVKVTETV